ncbi:Potassium-transporting ATPase ATP-binding subunit [Streptomyces hirsutus]
MFAAVHPSLDTLNIMRLASPESAILSAVVFNALIIVAAHPAGPARCALPARIGLGSAQPQPLPLRARRDRHPVIGIKLMI